MRVGSADAACTRAAKVIAHAVKTTAPATRRRHRSLSNSRKAVAIHVHLGEAAIAQYLRALHHAVAIGVVLAPLRRGRRRRRGPEVRRLSGRARGPDLQQSAFIVVLLPAVGTPVEIAVHVHAMGMAASIVQRSMVGAAVAVAVVLDALQAAPRVVEGLVGAAIHEVVRLSVRALDRRRARRRQATARPALSRARSGEQRSTHDRRDAHRTPSPRRRAARAASPPTRSSPPSSGRGGSLPPPGRRRARTSRRQGPPGRSWRSGRAAPPCPIR